MASEQQWTEIAEDELVEMWRERPCLFDTSIKAYSNRNSKSAALEDICLRLGKTVNDISKKMKNMRTQFNRLSKAPASGSGRRGLTQHQSWLLKNLEFLRPSMLRRETQTSFQLESTQNDEPEENELSSEDESMQTPASPIPSNSSWNADVQAGSSTPTCSESSKESDPSKPPATKKRGRNQGPMERAADRLNREKMAVLNRIAASIEKPLSLPDMGERMDEEESFAHYVATTLRTIKDDGTKRRVMGVLSTALFAEMSFLDNIPTQPPQQPAHHQAGGYVNFLNM